jgi:hypothetical protein
VALTVVNRGQDEPETVEIVLRDLAFEGPAEIRTVTAGGVAGPLPDLTPAQVTEGTENTKDGTVIVTLPPQSFTVIEAAMTSP